MTAATGGNNSMAGIIDRRYRRFAEVSNELQGSARRLAFNSNIVHLETA
jgi:hypothetical protein